MNKYRAAWSFFFQDLCKTNELNHMGHSSGGGNRVKNGLVPSFSEDGAWIPGQARNDKKEIYAKISLLILFFFLSFQLPAGFASQGGNIQLKEFSAHQKIYYFQHRLLPEWTHETKGGFFEDLMHDHREKLLRTASEIVGEEFSKNISVKKYENANAVLLTFPVPNKMPECFFIYIVKSKNGFEFYTYEKTIDLFGSGEKGVVGAWSADKRHINLGPRKYEDAESFVNDLKQSP